MRALLSASDKTGIVALAKGLARLGWELVSTGNTAGTIAAEGIAVTEVSTITGFPEILDGRVKTLHPAIHGGILARPDLANHTAQLDRHHISPIGLVVSNLYPFARAAANSAASFEDVIEQIDIGGPAMVRAAAKNHASVLVVTDPADYASVLEALASDAVTPELRRALATKAFAHTAAYDALIAAFLAEHSSGISQFPEELTIGLRKARDVRYGENPHQTAAAYLRLRPGVPTKGLLDAEQLGGKELSFNNYLDADVAWRAISVATEPTVAIVKHLIPCGLAVRSSTRDAFLAALAGDPVSAFGGIVACNHTVDDTAAREIARTFFEMVIAPAFTDGARAALRTKKNLRLLRLAPYTPERNPALELRGITGGMLVQQPDLAHDEPNDWTVATRRHPTDAEWRDLRFAWAAVRFVKSNAIVIAKNRAIVGVGAGQPNRVESVAIAAGKAGDRARGATLASDAFFPFADGVETAIGAGVTAVIQPGGSVRDSEVIAAANAAGVAMVLTGTRHFLH